MGPASPKAARTTSAMGALVLLAACTTTPPPGNGESRPEPAASTPASGGAEARNTAPSTASGGMSRLPALEAEVRAGIPAGAGDYARALALATLHKRGELTFAELEAAVLAMKLEPHPLGDAYLLMSPPPPPPGITFDPKMMPQDWEGNWGVVAQAFHLGELTQEEYEKLHRSAHPDCKP